MTPRLFPTTRGEVIVRLMPTGVRVWLRDRSAMRDIDQSTWDRAWTDDLASLDAALAEAVEELGITTGTPAVLVTDAPGLVVDVFAVPAAGSAALAAAQLALKESAATDNQAFGTAVMIAGRDAPPGARTQVIGAACPEPTLKLLAAWLARSGLAACAILPAPAAPLVHAVRAALASTPDVPCTVALVIDEHATAIAVGAEGGVRIARVLNIGVETLVAALRRSSGEHGSPTAIRTALVTGGIPRRGGGRSSGEQGGVADVVPALQSAVQRLIVELRQTIRFAAVPGSARAQLIAGGPGAAIPGLLDLLAENIDAGTATIIPNLEQADRAAALIRELSTLPERLIAQTEAHRATRWIYAGGVAAIALVVAEAGFLVHQTQSVNLELARLSAAVDDAQRARNSARKTEELRRLVADADAAIGSRMGPRTDWSVFLGELARVTPPEIRLTEIVPSVDGDRITARLTGDALVIDGGADVLKLYRDALSASPIVAEVELGMAELTRIHGRAARTFSITCSLRALPGRGSVAAASDAVPLQQEDAR